MSYMFTQDQIELLILEAHTTGSVGPLFFASPPYSVADSVSASASFALVDVGQRKVLVTCSHVWEDFKEKNRQNPALGIFLRLTGPCTDRLSDNQLIDCDKSLDVVTFDMGPMLAVCEGRKFFPLTRHPSSRVKKGDCLVCYGYPGVFRTGTEQGLKIGHVCYTICVSDVSGVRFLADISKARPDGPPEVVERCSSNPHGGMSGSPCFLVPGDPPKLVGFVTEVGMGSLWFTDARRLNLDGTINNIYEHGNYSETRTLDAG